ncbi:MAG: DUF29 domain-containing protein [Alphaproteobacteria bacterium]
MSETKALYDTDFLAWSKEQAAGLRSFAQSGSNQVLDWENLAEEIESLGISQKTALRSQMRRIILHLLKLEFSPAVEPRRGWFESVGDARSEMESLLETSPSLKSEVDSALAMALGQGSKKAAFDLEKYGEVASATLARIRTKTYTIEQILGDWYPPEPPHGEAP